jgi:hypothetical protein
MRVSDDRGCMICRSLVLSTVDPHNVCGIPLWKTKRTDIVNGRHRRRTPARRLRPIRRVKNIDAPYQHLDRRPIQPFPQ